MPFTDLIKNSCSDYFKLKNTDTRGSFSLTELLISLLNTYSEN